MPRLSLQATLTLAFAAVSVLMAVLLSALLGRLTADALRQDIGTSLTELADQMRARLDAGLADRLRTVELLASLQQMRDSDTAVADNRFLLEKLRRNDIKIAWIGFADVDGKVVYSADGILEGANVAARPWFISGKQGPFVGDVHEAKLLAKILPPPASGEPLRFVDVAAPVFGTTGHLRGVLGVHLSWEWARDIEQHVFTASRRASGVETFVLNREGQTLLAPQGRAGVLLPVNLDAAATGSGQLLRWPDGQDYVTTLVKTRGYDEYAGLGWSIVSRQAAQEAYAPVRQMQDMVRAIGAAMAVLFALFGLWLARRIAQPLHQLSHVADRLRGGEMNAQIPTSSTFVETAQLAGSFRHLVDALKAEQGKLQALNESLEEQVAKRTEALDVANRHLFTSLEERQRLVARLEELVHTDSLSGLLNRRALHERSAIELVRLERQPAPLALMIFDIDHFKRINDQHGHEAGDEAIRLLARTATGVLREVDILARFGGEEFVALLPDTPLAAAIAVAERLRLAIAAISIVTPAGPIGMTASFGLAAWEPGLSLDILISRADKALYGAKHGGRNRLVVWPDQA
ncbi:diguanylate cyclase [Chitinimonas viridis]|uniref:diguanylate cyclase n=1 Tax=Chitinimonas viridis TaxID=664880 RepID=A0ABT8B4D8_9NEIS|nr:diguanylate cyclase [Chitinimonas viridis]MDN3576359.1 diguanylate cyclase [Chitinimonas viridis]